MYGHLCHNYLNDSTPYLMMARNILSSSISHRLIHVASPCVIAQPHVPCDPNALQHVFITCQHPHGPSRTTYTSGPLVRRTCVDTHQIQCWSLTHETHAATKARIISGRREQSRHMRVSCRGCHVRWYASKAFPLVLGAVLQHQHGARSAARQGLQ